MLYKFNEDQKKKKKKKKKKWKSPFWEQIFLLEGFQSAEVYHKLTLTVVPFANKIEIFP